MYRIRAIPEERFIHFKPIALIYSPVILWIAGKCTDQLYPAFLVSRDFPNVFHGFQHILVLGKQNRHVKLLLPCQAHKIQCDAYINALLPRDGSLRYLIEVILKFPGICVDTSSAHCQESIVPESVEIWILTRGRYSSIEANRGGFPPFFRADGVVQF